MRPSTPDSTALPLPNDRCSKDPPNRLRPYRHQVPSLPGQQCLGTGTGGHHQVLVRERMQAAEVPQRQQAARYQEEHTAQPGPEGEPPPAVTAAWLRGGRRRTARGAQTTTAAGITDRDLKDAVENADEGALDAF